jgi:hypothetical protein
MGLIQSLNSGMCLTTDGVAGDQLYQTPCIPRLARYQGWSVVDIYPPDGWVQGAYNPILSLCIDVYRDSNAAGAPIDAWPCKGQNNQEFVEGTGPAY